MQPPMFDHRVQFYDSDAFLVKAVLEYIEPAQRSGDATIVIATRAHLDLLQAMRGASAGCARRDGRDHCVLLEARETLASFMVGAMPDEQRFDDVIGGLVRQVSDGGRRHVSAFGEMVAVLYADGHTEAAVRLEKLWDELAQRQRFSLLCAYRFDAFPDESHRHAFQCICAAHSRVNLIERLDGSDADPQALHRTIALLQQQANALEIELQRRRDVERALDSQTARLAALSSAQEELESLAGNDALTALPNRRIFTDRLAHAVQRSARTTSPVALLYIDLDEFKALNDRYGHAAGDQLLQQVAVRLGLCVRVADTVCRWGGDEFAIIAEDTGVAQAAVLVQRIAAALGEAFLLEDASIEMTASVGVGHYPDDAGDAHSLLRRADAAMHLVKRSGGSGIRAALPDRGGAAAAFMTVEDAARSLRLSRPHVLKLIVEQRFDNVIRPHGGALLIPAREVSRVARELRG